MTRAPSGAVGDAAPSSKALVPVAPRPLRMAEPQVEELALEQAIRGPARLGLLLVFGFLAGFLLWGASVPIAGGAVAPGVISPDGSRRVVQHLEGGIIAEIRVRDGDRVAAGEALVVLEDVQARAAYRAHLDNWRSLLMLQARLLAEQQGTAELTLPEALADAPGDAALARIQARQRDLFDSRRATHALRASILRSRVEQSLEQIGALQAQVESSTEQLALIADELVGKEYLLRQGTIPRPEVLRLRRMQAELRGRQGEYRGMIARLREAIGETEMQLVALEADRADRLAEQLEQVRRDLAAGAEQLLASRDVLARTIVPAPVSGTVVNLRFRTVGGVIGRGESILDIVPDDERLLIDARVAPGDSDVAHVGLPVQVRLTAYSSQTIPRLTGTVVAMSADRLTDANTGTPYYLARVEVRRDDLSRLGQDVALLPGMPAEVVIVRRERTLIAYIVEPLTAMLWRSLREE